MRFNLCLDESMSREESDTYVAAATDRKVTRPVLLHIQRADPERRPDHEGAVRRWLFCAYGAAENIKRGLAARMC